MPYAVTFEKKLQAADLEPYFNDCCFGGDVVSDILLAEIRKGHREVQANQEDWGWFIWLDDGAAALAVDIMCDEVERGLFRIHLTSRVKRLLTGSRIADTPELERLKDRVVDALTQWLGKAPGVRRVEAREVE